jgi:hypothetical protein
MTEQTKKFSIVLLPDDITNEIRTILDHKKILFMDPKPLFETANGIPLNDSKYNGTICLNIAQGYIVAIPNAKKLMTKKGTMSLMHTLVSRIPETAPENYHFILVSTHDDIPAQIERNPLFDWANKRGQIVTLDQFKDLEIVTRDPFLDKIKITCGLSTSFLQDNKEMTGHVTRDYGLLFNDSILLQENNQRFINKTYNGEVIQLILDDTKKSGYVVYVPDLGSTAHITVNTLIKAALSGPIVQKYKDNIMEFPLQSIDLTAKQNPIIKISHLNTVNVTISGWYVYAIEQIK